MIRFMSSKHENGNGHFGVELFRRWFIGIYYYPGRQIDLSFIRVWTP